MSQRPLSLSYQFAQAQGAVRFLQCIDLIDEIVVCEIFAVKNPGDMVFIDRLVGRYAGKGGKQVRTVTDLRNGLSDSGSTCQTYCHGGAGRNDRFERPVCLERMPCRTVGFHKNIISLKRKNFKRDRGRGRGQLAIGKRLSQTDDPAAGQSGPDLLQDLLPGDRRVLCSGFYKRHVWKRIDMR